MTNKFKEIKKAEEEIKQKLEAEKRSGEAKVAEIEKAEDEAIEKMRAEIKEKRHSILDEERKLAEAEAAKLINEAEEEIKNFKVNEAAIQESAKLVAQRLIS